MTTEPMEWERFVKAMELISLSVHHRAEDGSWDDRVRWYFERLRHYGERVFMRAAMDACDAYDWTPTLRQLNELCTKQHKRALAVSAPRLTAHEPKGGEGDEYRDRGLAELINRGASFKEIEEYCQEQMDAGLMAWEPGYSHPEHGRRKAS